VRPPRPPAEAERCPEPSLGEVSQSELQISAVHAAPSPGEVLGDMSMSAVLAATPSRMAGVAGEETGIAPSALGFQGITPGTTPMPQASEDDDNNSWDEEFDHSVLADVQPQVLPMADSDDGSVPLPDDEAPLQNSTSTPTPAPPAHAAPPASPSVEMLEESVVSSPRQPPPPPTGLPQMSAAAPPQQSLAEALAAGSGTGPPQQCIGRSSGSWKWQWAHGTPRIRGCCDTTASRCGSSSR